MNRNVKTEVTKPILAQLREMKVGDILVFPAERRGTVKSMCSEFGFEWNKVFSTSINRQERTISVTRRS
ncbi:MAG: hypothetical protein SPF56_08450 [Bacteroidaceae bacterium]|nr:hypothetical protein [Bacteroidaceae bacterium]